MIAALFPLFGLTVLLLTAEPALSGQQDDALMLLNRLSTAARKLSYTGTFVYQNGTHSESSRIIHFVDGGNELERLEVLDGSPREVVRDNDEVKCYLPDSHLVIVERRSHRRDFPALLPIGMADLADHYVLRTGTSARVAGFDSRSVLIEPRDEYRYGHKFWVHVDSGLLLKAGMFDEHGEILESFAFTQLQIGGPIDRQSLKPHFEASAANSADWHVDQIQPQESRFDDPAWVFRNTLPGFRHIAGMKRPARPGAPESTHVVFSDGLATISVFIEPLSGPEDRKESGLSRMGAVNVYKRVVGDALAVVMGEVPVVSLIRLGDGIEARKRQ
jgi:sigma-E factor negative regulatory protein RseB